MQNNPMYFQHLLATNSVKIGIILTGDHQTEFTFCIPTTRKFMITDNISQYTLQPNIQYQGKILTNQLLSLSNIPSSLHLPARIIGEEKISVSSQDCLTLFNVPVGRNFHWQSYITEYLPGDLEINIQDGYLVIANILPLEIYLLCVATSEMNPECPCELVKAQIIAARSWFLAHAENKHQGLDACNDDCCQRYQGLGKILPQLWDIAQTVSGVVLTYNGKICDARYSKSCGGVTESSEIIWPEIQEPYLVPQYDNKISPDTQNRFDSPTSHPDKLNANIIQHLNLSTEIGMQDWLAHPPACFCSPQLVSLENLTKYLGIVDIVGQYYRWQKIYSAIELEEILRNKLALPEIARIRKLEILQRGYSGRINRLKIYYEDKNCSQHIYMLTSEYQIRATLHPKFLYSSAFCIQEEYNFQGYLTQIVLNGAGWGHGVGLCQIGALGMSLLGYSYQEILSHYFKNSQLIYWNIETCMQILRNK